jgi:hypothetical protein
VNGKMRQDKNRLFNMSSRPPEQLLVLKEGLLSMKLGKIKCSVNNYLYTFVFFTLNF